MSGETDLETLLRALSPVLIKGVFVFATIKEGPVPASLTPRMVFHEAEGITLILDRTEATAQGLSYDFPCRMITLNIHSSLDAVGFLARITAELAKKNMGVNPVSAFYHDHLFVPEGRAGEAMTVLRQIADGIRPA